jgi:hypothetical protein
MYLLTCMFPNDCECMCTVRPASSAVSAICLWLRREQVVHLGTRAVSWVYLYVRVCTCPGARPKLEGTRGGGCGLRERGRTPDSSWARHSLPCSCAAHQLDRHSRSTDEGVPLHRVCQIFLADRAAFALDGEAGLVEDDALLLELLILLADVDGSRRVGAVAKLEPIG